MVSLTPEAQHRAVELARGHAVELAYWPTQDPTLAMGSREAVLDAYREARDALAARIRARFGKPRRSGDECALALLAYIQGWLRTAPHESRQTRAGRGR